MSDAPVFLGRQAPADKASFWVIPAPIEETADIMSGQSAAPAAIVGASLYLEDYDEEVANNPSVEAPVHTLAGDAGSIPEVQAAVAKALDAVAVPVVLGGEPASTLGALRALSEKCEEFTVLHIGSRAGLKDEGMGKKESSASVMRRALDLPNLKKIVQVGVISVSAEESNIIFSDDSRVEPFFNCDLAKAEDDSWHDDVVSNLSTPVYVSIDLSAFGRGVVPSVGHPEPGGLGWWQVLRLLRKVSQRRRIAGFDIVDLVPIEGDLIGDLAAARLCYKLMAYIKASGKMLDKDNL